MSNKNEPLLEHDYDGIQEYDNPLPGWWLATFYGAIIFSVFYVGYYHFGPGLHPMEELAQNLKEMQAAKNAQIKAEPELTEAELLAIFGDSNKQAAGKIIFAEKCASCHMADGGGSIGPNLTDNFWIHGKGTLSDILKVVGDGVAEKGMPPWKAMLKKEELLSAVVYAKSLHGKKPANPKEPQGIEAN